MTTRMLITILLVLAGPFVASPALLIVESEQTALGILLIGILAGPVMALIYNVGVTASRIVRRR